MWWLFAGLHLAGNVGYNLLLRSHLKNKVDPWLMVVIMQASIALPMFIIGPWFFPGFDVYQRSDILLIPALGVLTTLYHVANTQALKRIEAGTFALLFSSRIIFVTLLAWWLIGERTQPFAIIGGALIFMAIACLRHPKHREIKIGYYWALAAGLLLAIIITFEKDLINRAGFFGYASAAMTSTSIAGATASAFYWRDRPLPRMPNLKKLAPFLVVRVVSGYGLLITLASGAPVVIANYISSLGIVLSVIGGYIFLGERDDLRRKAAAVCLAMAGVICIVVSRP